VQGAGAALRARARFQRLLLVERAMPRHLPSAFARGASNLEMFHKTPKMGKPVLRRSSRKAIEDRHNPKILQART
jgi:hypothetical protein